MRQKKQKHLWNENNFTLQCKTFTHLNRVPWLLLTWPPRMSSSCQCMNFWLKPWQPPWRPPAMSGLWIDEQKRRWPDSRQKCKMFLVECYNSVSTSSTRIQQLQSNGFSLPLLVPCWVRWVGSQSLKGWGMVCSCKHVPPEESKRVKICRWVFKNASLQCRQLSINTVESEPVTWRSLKSSKIKLGLYWKLIMQAQMLHKSLWWIPTKTFI